MRPEELLSAHGSLRADLEGGRLSQGDFEQACAGLMARDARGRWWAVDVTGRSMLFDVDRQQWIAARPPAASGDDANDEALPDPESQGRPFRETSPEPEVIATVEAPAASPGSVRRVAPPISVAGRKRSKARLGGKFAKVVEPGARVPPIAGVAPTASGQSTAAMFAAAFGASAVVSWIGWDALGIVPQAINAVIPTGSCTGFAPASIGMYFCSALVGLRVVFGSLVLAVVLVILRKPITVIVGQINQWVPARYRSILPALVAAVFFAVVWSGSHATTGALMGILPHRLFPALVGVFVQAAMVWGPDIMTRHATFFGLRDRMPKIVRWIIVVMVPIAVSLLITAEQRVSNEAFKQQFVVLVGMITAWVLLTPRSGRLADLRADLETTIRGRKVEQGDA